MMVLAVPKTGSSCNSVALETRASPTVVAATATTSRASTSV